MSTKNDIIIGRRGIESLTGQVNDANFVITTLFGDLTIPKKAIAQIHYKNLPAYQQDVIWTWVGDKHAGKIKSTEVNFTVHTGQELKVPTKLIHTIFFMDIPKKKTPSLLKLLK